MQRSKAKLLPEATRAELDKRLIESGFSGYAALAEWLQSEGFQISKAAVHRYGSTFEERCAALKVATDQARVVCESAPDDDGYMAEALMRLTQEKLFTVLTELEVDPETIDLNKLTRAIADINRSSVSLKKYQAEVKLRVKAAADNVEAIALRRGMGRDTIDEIKRELMGIR